MINRESRLTRSLVFAWRARETLDQVSGVVGVPTNLSREHSKYMAYKFAGGGEGNSDLNFGLHSSTNDLHEQPATWAFVATMTTASHASFACHIDSNVSSGWQIGSNTVSGNTRLGLLFIRSTTNFRSVIQRGEPVNAGPFSFVVVSDGAVPAPSVKFYFNGVQETNVFTSGGVGTTSPATAQNLYLGRSRVDGGVSHAGNIQVALIASRMWSYDEVLAFHRDPVQVFNRPARLGPQFGKYGSGLGNNALFFGSGSVG